MFKIIRKFKRDIFNKLSLFYFRWLKEKMFNRQNITKLFIIFTVGFVSRVLINYIYEINVFIEYTNVISYIYYLIMALFTIIVHDFIAYFDIVITPIFNNIITFFGHGLSLLIRYVFSFLNILQKFFNMKWFKLPIWLIKIVFNCVVKYYYIKGCEVKDFSISYLNSNDKGDSLSGGNRVSTSKQNGVNSGLRRIEAKSNLRKVAIENNQCNNQTNNKKIVNNMYNEREKNNGYSPKPIYFKPDQLSNKNEICFLPTNTPDSYLDSQSVKNQSNSSNCVNQSIESSQSGNNEICIRQIDNTAISGNKHNSGKWSSVGRNLNSPNLSVQSTRGSVSELGNVSERGSSVVGKNIDLDFELRRNQIEYDMKQHIQQQMIDPNAGILVEQVTISNKGIVGQLKL